MPEESLDHFLSGLLDTLVVVLVESCLKLRIKYLNRQRRITKILFNSLFSLIRLLSEYLESTFLSLDKVIVEALQICFGVRIL